MATKNNKKSTKKLSFRKTSPLKMLLAVVVVSAVAGIGTYLLTRSNAATAVGPHMYMAASNNTQEATFTDFDFGIFGDKYVAGDWNKDGKDTLGVYRPSNATFYLTDNNSSAGVPGFGFGNSGDIPIAGDWDGIGGSTFGVYRPATATFYLAKENKQGGGAVETFVLGNPGDVPITCDWNGDGITDLGLFRRSEGKFYMALRYGTWGVFKSFYYGNAGITDIPVCGNWDNSAANDANFNYDTVGVYRGVNFYLINTNDAGNGIEQRFGQLEWLPLVGRWTGTAQTLIGAYSLGTAAVATTPCEATGMDVKGTENLKRLQLCINSLIKDGGPTLTPDGILGPLTKAACIKYMGALCPVYVRDYVVPTVTPPGPPAGTPGAGPGPTIQGGIETYLNAAGGILLDNNNYCLAINRATLLVVANAKAIEKIYNVYLKNKPGQHWIGDDEKDNTTRVYWQKQTQSLESTIDGTCFNNSKTDNANQLTDAKKYRTSLKEANDDILRNIK